LIQIIKAALSHVKVRKQFGSELSSFQNVQFKLTDMAIKLNTSRLMVRQAARLLDEKAVNAVSWCAMAKAYATEECFQVTDEALQLHGGIFVFGSSTTGLF
jgi:isobutyryl-CoA dehydrogenase